VAAWLQQYIHFTGKPKHFVPAWNGTTGEFILVLVLSLSWSHASNGLELPSFFSMCPPWRRLQEERSDRSSCNKLGGAPSPIDLGIPCFHPCLQGGGEEGWAGYPKLLGSGALRDFDDAGFCWSTSPMIFWRPSLPSHRIFWSVW
jgi:hypothetical protein